MRTVKELVDGLDLVSEPSNRLDAPVWEGEVEDFDELFGGNIGFSELFCSRVREHWVDGANWLCSSDRVGLSFYTLDGELVAMSSRTARKCDKYIHFLSDEALEKMRRFYFECLLKETPHFLMTSLEQEIEDSWFRPRI